MLSYDYKKRFIYFSSITQFNPIIFKAIRQNSSKKDTNKRKSNVFYFLNLDLFTRILKSKIDYYVLFNRDNYYFKVIADKKIYCYDLKFLILKKLKCSQEEWKKIRSWKKFTIFMN